jgi:hypothetical protein
MQLTLSGAEEMLNTTIPIVYINYRYLKPLQYVSKWQAM